MKTSKEEMLRTIYKKIGAREDHRNDLAIHASLELGVNVAGPLMQAIVGKYKELCSPRVMIGDVLDWANPTIESINDIFGLWEFMRKPIDDQDDDCIEFIYNLCKDA